MNIIEDTAEGRIAEFDTEPEVVLVKILAMGPLKGFKEKPRDDRKVEAKHFAEAAQLGVQPRAMRRERTDTGLPFYEKEEGVNIGALVRQLMRDGYRPKEFFWQQQNNKGPVNTIVFARPGKPEAFEPVRVPDEAWKLVMEARWNHATVWGNIRRNHSDGREFRLDTVNVAKSGDKRLPTRRLKRQHRVGYQLA